MSPRYGDHQIEIHLNGLTGIVPDHPMTFTDLADRASHALPPGLWSYVAGGAGDENTQDANARAFTHWGLYPRMFVGATDRDLSVDLCGIPLASPLLMAPVGVIGLCSTDGHGDIATARAAATTGVPMIASTLTQDPMEDVAPHLGDTPGLFQLYTPTDRDLAASLVHRAQHAGFKAIVVTLDTWITGWRPRDLATATFPQLRGHCLANYTSDPVFQKIVGPDPTPDRVVATWAGLFGNPLTWDDLPWLRSLTDLPLIVKGICPGVPARGRRRHRPARHLRLRGTVGLRHRQGPGPGGHRGRGGPSLRLRTGGGRHRRTGARPAVPVGRGRPLDGRQRLPLPGRPDPRRPQTPALTAPAAPGPGAAEKGSATGRGP
ncbi:alpha-hydroxy-acid oxidizing protein [Nocardiopsis lambiniae]